MVSVPLTHQHGPAYPGSPRVELPKLLIWQGGEPINENAPRSNPAPIQRLTCHLYTRTPRSGELPEGVTVDQHGNVFASLSPLGQLVKIPTGTNEAVFFGSVSGLASGDIGLLGLAVDQRSNVYGAVYSPAGTATGVWKFDRDTGAEELVPGTDAMMFPNSVAFDKRGTMYITDTIAGAVWRVARGGTAELWIQSDLLKGNGAAGFPFPIGANGIAVRHNTVYVGVTEQGSIVNIPIGPKGAPGVPSVLATIQSAAIDGIALDVHGNVYFADPLNRSVVKVSADGSSYETISDDGGFLDGPTSVVFGTSHGNNQSLYVANFSVALGGPLGAGPSVVSIDVGVPGQPVP